MNETEVLDKLTKIIELAKEIHELDETLGSVIISATKLSMDLYESIAKGEFYGINEVAKFVANMQGITTHALLTKSYPQQTCEMPTADEDLTKFIMNASSVYEPDTDGYEQTVKDLVSDFKTTVSELRKGD